MKSKTVDVLTSIIVVGAISIFIAGSCYLGMWWAEAKCTARWDGTYPHKWGILSYCMVQIDNKWMPEENVRAIP